MSRLENGRVGRKWEEVKLLYAVRPRWKGGQAYATHIEMT